MNAPNRLTSSRVRSVTLTTLAGLLAAACGGGGGGGGGGSSAPPPPPNASPGGIWKGTTSNGQSLLGFVTEEGEFTFLQADGVQYFCNMSVSGQKVAAGFTGITPVGTTFPDGSTSGSGSMDATLAERSTLSGSISFTTAGAAGVVTAAGLAADAKASASGGCGASAASAATGASDHPRTAMVAAQAGQRQSSAVQAVGVSGTFSLAYDALYERDSSLATIAGNFQRPDGTVVTVDASGNIFSQDAATGCVANGKVTIIDARYNLYRLQYTFGNCTGDWTVLNDRTFRGLAMLDNKASPERVVTAVTYQSGTQALGLTDVLDRV